LPVILTQISAKVPLILHPYLIKIYEESTAVMKKISVAVIGGVLFIAGYFQVRRQTEYVSAKAMMVSPAPAAKPMVIPFKSTSTFAFRLDAALTGTR